MTYSFGVRVALCAVLLVPITTAAQESCGDIISINPYNGETEQIPIEDCNDPFAPNQAVPEGLDLVVDGVEVEPGTNQVAIPNESFQYIGPADSADFQSVRGYRMQVYQQSNDDFVQIDLRPPSLEDLSQAEGLAVVEEYYAADPDVEVYKEVYLTDDTSGLTIEQNISYSNFLFTGVLQILQEQYSPKVPTGSYSVVFTEEVLCLSQEPTQTFWLARLLDTLIPTAHAQLGGSCSPGYIPKRFVLELDILQESEEPAGASSVLFLPGIMGSRLYEEGQQCGDLGDVQQRWFSNSDCEQLRLLTRFDGRSINDIYTRSVDEAVIDKVAVFSLYDSFMYEMNQLENNGTIADFVPFAYDWRLRLDDLLQATVDTETKAVRYEASTQLEDGHLYKTVQKMVEDSHNDKVTIVTHSNGGLLAKTFMTALQAAEDPLLEDIDKVIMVAAPQVGTPDAAVGLLQGSDIFYGLVVKQETARKILSTAPFAHHLLPNQNYFSGDGVSIGTPVISFLAGSSTDDWLATYGSGITDQATLHQFLSKDSGRAKPVVDDLLQPEVVDAALLNYASTIAAVTGNWTPNLGTQVYQIAGTGVETPSGITYFTDQECVSGGFLWFECTKYMPKLGYYINFTHDGDQTVVAPSALAMVESDNIQRLWLNLKQEDRVHNNILESSNLIDFITAVVESTTTPDLPQSLSKTAIDVDAGERLRFFLHSPLDIYVEHDGDITSSSTSDVPRVIYRRYGEVQYVSVPADTTGLTLVMNGYAEGSFSFTVQEWAEENLVDTYAYTAVPTSDSAVIEVSLDTFNPDTTLQIDIDGDGVVDGVVSAADDVVVPMKESILPQSQEEEEVEISTGSSDGGPQVTDTAVRQSAASDLVGQVAGVSISADEQWYYKELEKILEDIAVLLEIMATQYEK